MSSFFNNLMDFLELMKLCFGYPSRLSPHPTPQKFKGFTGDAVPVIGRGFRTIVLGNLRAPLRIGYEGAQCLSDGGDGCGIEPGGQPVEARTTATARVQLLLSRILFSIFLGFFLMCSKWNLLRENLRTPNF